MIKITNCTNRFLSNSLMVVLLLIIACSTEKTPVENTKSFSAPAYPLITIDPYTSAWSTSDQLFDTPIKHWTGRNFSLIGALRVDGEVYRFLGKEKLPLQPVFPDAKYGAWAGKYSLKKPANGWENTDFDDSGWKTGNGAFGSVKYKQTNTTWKTKGIWIRRAFEVDTTGNPSLFLVYSHDNDFVVYLNGTEILKTSGRAENDMVLKLDNKLLNSNGKNVIAAYCMDRGGWSYVDFGIFRKNSLNEMFDHAAVQNKVALSATQTSYSFTCGPVDLNLKFVSPLLPDDLDLLSRPVNYINYEIASNDGKKHEVQIYFEATPEWAVNEVNQEIEARTGTIGNISFAKAGTTEQPILKKKGDNVRIDWGYFYIASEDVKNKSVVIGDFSEVKNSFIEEGKLFPGENRINSIMTKSMPVLACTENMGKISSKQAKGHIMVAYDDVESIQYFHQNLKAWWTKSGQVTINDALVAASSQYLTILDRCAAFDEQLWQDALQCGGENYAKLCALAYRQSIAAHKLVKDKEDNILFFSKENFSNGSIGTVDVTYPSAPVFLKYNPGLLKGMLNPIFFYSESGKWNKPFAAHDVGTYPKANGQTYGADMPVEECGNMLILTTAIANVEGNAKYAEQHWEILTIWVNYLLENGLNPDNQLCTDDFAGHLAHNTNLSIKAIMGIAGYGKLAGMLGKNDIAEEYTSEAKQMAIEWIKMADDGDHFRLTFNQPGTWSQKYNLVWDKLLHLGIFPEEVAQKEVAYYLTRQNEYGLPLDIRKTYTKSDWIVWTATLANDKETFQKFIDPLYLYVTETPTRVPMSDWYETIDAKQVGFQARSVVGGYFIKMLENKK